MHAVTYGVSRDQMMARHKANHIQVVYARNAKDADLALYTKAALARELGSRFTSAAPAPMDRRFEGESGRCTSFWSCARTDLKVVRVS